MELKDWQVVLLYFVGIPLALAGFFTVVSKFNYCSGHPHSASCQDDYSPADAQW